MKAAPLPDNEKDRLAVLESYGILDTPPEAVFDAITQLAADICDVPIALISLVDSKRQWFKSSYGLPGVRETSRQVAFCAHAISRPELMEIADATLDERFQSNPLVQNEPRIRFYAGMPLITSDGFALGTLCTIGRQPKRLSPSQKTALRRLSTVVITLLEAKRRSLAARLGEILEESFNEIYLFDVDTLDFLHVNAGARRNLQYSMDELKQLSAVRINADLSDNQFAKLVAPLRSGEEQLVVFETNHLRKNGSTYPVEVRLQLSSGDDRPVFIAIGNDITERKKAEEALRESERRLAQIADGAEQVFWLINWSKKKLLYVNPAYERIWDRSAKRLYADPNDWLNGIHQDDRPAVEDVFLDEAATRGFQLEYRIVRGDGSVRRIRDRRIPLHNEHGEVFRIAGVAEDTTEARQAEIRNRELLDQLAHASRLSAMGEMASTLAHELNQPLTAIAHYCDAAITMARSSPHPDTELLEVLDEAHGQAQRAGDIIRNLRQFVSKQVTQKSPEDLNALIRETMEFANPEFRNRGVKTRLTLAENLRPLMLNKVQIQQVLVNLERNSLEAMELANSSPRELTIATATQGNGTVQVTVHDTGPGLDAEAEARLFKPFQTSKPKGMGLGLSISRSIIEAHGGRLWAQTGAGDGTTFHFTLPMSSE